MRATLRPVLRAVRATLRPVLRAVRAVLRTVRAVLRPVLRVARATLRPVLRAVRAVLRAVRLVVAIVLLPFGFDVAALPQLTFADFSFAQGKSMLFNGAEQKHARVHVHDQLFSNL